ncbi:hypothetical protein P9112_010329 [Eukaryota sp. TZLM1-RC]
MNCTACREAFDSTNRQPLLICKDNHSVCASCTKNLTHCNICNARVLPQPKKNNSLLNLVVASNVGSLCPEIPSSDIKIGHKIGEGGQAVVFDGIWCGAPVALKAVSLTDKGVEMLRREVSFLSRLANPHILRVFGLTYLEDKVAIVMEKASTSLNTPSKLSPMTLKYAIDICNAVAYLHSQSAVHGDIKPGNILILHGEVRISDFGTSRTIAKTTKLPSSTAITAKYAPPEAFANKIHPAGDVYSVGVVLYELLTNTTAFAGLDPMALFGAKMYDNPLPFPANVPPALSELISNCCRKEPKERPCIDEVIIVLESLRNSASLQANKVQSPISNQVNHRPSNSDIERAVAQANAANENRIVGLQHQVEQIACQRNQIISERDQIATQRDQQKAELDRVRTENQSLQKRCEELLRKLESTKDEVSKLKEANISQPLLPAGLSRRHNLNASMSRNGIAEGPQQRLTPFKYSVQINDLCSVAQETIGKIRRGMEEVRAHDSGMQDNDVFAIADALKGNIIVNKVSLKNLKNGYSTFSDRAVKAVVISLHDNTTITSLTIGSPNIGPVGAASLAELLLANRTLTELDLTGCRVSNSGIISIAKSLEQNNSLKELKVGGNDIGTIGIMDLSEALKVNNGLQHLDLSSQQIGLEGVIALAEALKVNNGLQHLDLSSQNIGSEGVIALAEALKDNRTLVFLDVRRQEQTMAATRKHQNDCTRPGPRRRSFEGSLFDKQIDCECLGVALTPKDMVTIGKYLKDNDVLAQLLFDVSSTKIYGNCGTLKLESSVNVSALAKSINLGKKGSYQLDSFPGLALLTLIEHVDIHRLQFGHRTFKGTEIRFDFNHYNIDDSGATAIASRFRELLINPAFEQGQYYVNLIFRSNSIGLQGAISLANLVAEFPRISELILYAYPLNFTFKKNHFFARKVSFDFKNSNINNAKAASIASSLSSFLHCTDFGRGAYSVSLIFHNNEIGFKGAKSLMKLLDDFSCISHLDLTENPFSEDEVEQLSLYLYRRKINRERVVPHIAPPSKGRIKRRENCK